MRGNLEPEGVGELTSLMALAHELKTPLSLIRQLAISREYFDESQTEVALRRIELVSERSLRLVEVLTRSYQAQDLNSETVNLNRICQEVIHEFMPFCKELGQTVEFKSPNQPLLAVGNKEIIHSVLMGLCDNAFAYSDTSRPVVLQLQRRNNQARLSVIDSGPKIANSKYKSKDRVGVAPQSLSNRPQSSGLGLYIAQQFAEAMHGSIGMRQHRSGGQSFYLNLPQSTQLNLFSL